MIPAHMSENHGDFGVFFSQIHQNFKSASAKREKRMHPDAKPAKIAKCLENRLKLANLLIA